MKKVLSLVLVMAMVLSSMSFAFGASTFEDIADIDYAEAIETLTALGVVTGYEDGTYRPEKTVTRAEMAKLMVQLLGYGDLVAGSKSNFSDTQGHWADSYIGLAAGRGIVVGTGGGKFDPESPVSYDAVLTMLVRGLGYTDSSNELKNMPWPTNFKVKAAELNITKNVAVNATGADRGGVAQAMFNALDQQLVKVNSDGDIVREYTSVGKDQEPVNLISRVATPKYDFKVEFQHIDPEDKNYAGNKVDLSGYLFQTVEAYFNKNDNKEVVYVGDVDSLTYKDTFESDTFGDTSKKLEQLEVGDYTFDVKSASVSYNNAEMSLSDLKDGDLDDANITVVLADTESRIKDNAGATGIIVEKASDFVQIEEEYKADATSIDEIYLPVKSKKVDSENLIVKGDATKLSDIKKDDIVVAYVPYDNEDPTVEAPDKLTLVVSRKTVEGKVTGTASEAYYIDKTKYKINNALSIDVLDIGDEGTFYLDNNDKIIAFKGESEGDKTYAYVEEMISGRYEVNGTGDNAKATVTRAPKVKLHTASNETITYSVDFDLKQGKYKDALGVEKDGWVIDDAKLALIFEVDQTLGAGDKVISIAKDKNNVELITGKLVSYSIDSKSKEITAIEEAGRPIKMKTDSKSFVLASNAVIFDEDGDVISESKLGTEVEGSAVYKNGKIVALYAENTADEETYYYAYINSVYLDTDNDGDKVQRVNAYIQGSKNEKLFTAEKNILDGFNNDNDTSEDKKSLYILGLTDDGVVNSSKGTESFDTTKATTVSAISSSTGKIEGLAGGTVYFDQNAGTIIRIKTDVNGKISDVESVGKMTAIKAKETKILTFQTITGYEDGKAIKNNTVNFIIIVEQEVKK
jgi:S-layer family protein